MILGSYRGNETTILYWDYILHEIYLFSSTPESNTNKQAAGVIFPRAQRGAIRRLQDPKRDLLVDLDPKP